MTDKEREALITRLDDCAAYHQRGDVNEHDTEVSQLCSDAAEALAAPAPTAALQLFDNRLGWSDGRNPYAPRKFWADLGAELYGEDDPRVQELRGAAPQPDTEHKYPCDDCGTMRTKAEGGTTFTVCEECWDKRFGKRASRPDTVGEADAFAISMSNKFGMDGIIEAGAMPQLLALWREKTK